MPTKKAPSSQVMDVTHPNKVKPTTSSIPIIITNRPLMKDPMMLEEGGSKPSEAVQPAPVKEVSSSKKLELKPLSAAELTPANLQVADASEAQGAPLLPIAGLEQVGSKKVEDVPEKSEPIVAEDSKEPPANMPQANEESGTEQVAEPSAAAAHDQTAEKAKDADDTPTEAILDNAGDTPAGDFLSNDRPADTKAAKEAREAAEKQLALEKLIAEGTYVLPVNTVERRRIHEIMLVVVLIVLVLGIAGFLLALDAGYLHIAGFPAPTHFIKG